MKLYLLRHGIAAPTGEGADADRSLTEEGAEKTRKAARGLAALEVAPDLVFTSPLRRAVETAAIAAKELGVKDVRLTRSLLPAAEPEDLIDDLEGVEADAVLAVGHLPHLDAFIAHAVGQRRRAITGLGKAGAACLEFEPGWRGEAHLVWLLTPRMLRQLGRD